MGWLPPHAATLRVVDLPFRQTVRLLFGSGELGLIKIRHQSGRLVYAPPEAAEVALNEALSVALGRWALGLEPSGNLVVVTTPAARDRVR